MKIIKPGKKPEDDLMGGKCMRCGCVVECKASEAKYVFDQRDGDFHHVTCPTCGNIYLYVGKKGACE